MRGQQFGFLATLCIIWVTARVGFLSILPEPVSGPSIPREVAAGTATLAAKSSVAKHTAEQSHRIPFSGRTHFHQARSTVMAAGRLPTTGISAVVASLAPAPGILPPSFPTFAPSPLANLRTTRSDRLKFYAYSYFRKGSPSAGLPVGGQYGGSQSGFITTYDLAGNHRLAFLFRGAIAHDVPAQHELATGVRWQPAQKIPVLLTAERRFRNARNDAFALYLAGGMSDIVMPEQFRLEVFAQAGVVSGKDAGPFFDLATRTRRKVADIGAIPVTLGAGIWGGGQKDVFRIDSGPTIGAVIPVGDGTIRVDADWRFRIAGDARPGSGPALTLSTSF